MQQNKKHGPTIRDTKFQCKSGHCNKRFSQIQKKESKKIQPIGITKLYFPPSILLFFSQSSERSKCNLSSTFKSRYFTLISSPCSLSSSFSSLCSPVSLPEIRWESDGNQQKNLYVSVFHTDSKLHIYTNSTPNKNTRKILYFKY